MAGGGGVGVGGEDEEDDEDEGEEGEDGDEELADIGNEDDGDVELTDVEDDGFRAMGGVRQKRRRRQCITCIAAMLAGSNYVFILFYFILFLGGVPKG